MDFSINADNKKNKDIYSKCKYTNNGGKLLLSLEVVMQLAKELLKIRQNIYDLVCQVPMIVRPCRRPAGSSPGCGV